MSKKASAKKKEERTGEQIAKGLTGGISKITSCYVILMFAVFPLFITDKYYNCLKDKYYFFFYATAAITAIVLFLYLAGIAMGAFKGVGVRKVFGRLTLTDKFMMAFLVVCGLSTCLSEWKYESFWGNMGRLQGMFFFILITLGYFVVTRAYRFNKKHLYILLAAGIVVSLWGVIDYLGVDPLCWREDAGDYWGMLIFTSTIGNVNTFTAIVALYFGMSAFLSCKLEKPWFALASFSVSTMAMAAGQSDNAVLSVGITMAVLPFLLFENRKGVIRYLVLVVVFFASLWVIGLVTASWTATEVLPEVMWGVLLTISNKYTKYCLIIAAAFAGIALLLWLIRKNDISKKVKGLRAFWGIICTAVLAAVIYAFVDANSGRHAEFWKPYENILVFNDSWGTFRGYAWRNTFEFFKDFSIFKKLIGSGPETYAIFMAENCYYEMIERSGTVFDSPHSEPIQMLFTTGLFGFISYYGVFVTAVIRGLKKNTWSRACAVAVTAYLFASVINISVPLTTPLFFLLMELSLIIGEKDEETP